MITRFRWFVVLVLVAVSLAVAVIDSGDAKVRTPEERVIHLASQIRCPSCAGLSVEQSDAPMARSSKDEIRTRVADGQTDEQIKAYFVSRYGDTALMSPERTGINRIPWLLPVVVVLGLLILLGYALRTWRNRGARSGDLSSPSDDDRMLVDSALKVPQVISGPSELVAERDFLLQSIEELDREHVSGTLEDAEYSSLRDQQVVRAAAVIRQLNADVVEKPSVRVARVIDQKRRMVWVGGVTALMAVSVFGVFYVAEDRTDGITGSVAENSVSLIAKAQELTAEGKAADAVKTYDKVLKLDSNNALALTYKGWLLNLAGFEDEGLSSIQRAIDVQPSLADPHFFKGYILMNSKNDPAGAAREFETFLASNPPQQMVPMVEQALNDARARMK